MKNIRLIVAMTVCVLMLGACRPKGVPSPREMEDLLVDLHFTDGVLTEAGMMANHDEEVRGYYAAVLAKHHITQAEFDTALVWYTRHSVKFEKIYPKVQARLDKRLAAMNGPKTADGAAKSKEIKSPEQLTREYLYGLEYQWPEERKKYKISPILQFGK